MRARDSFYDRIPILEAIADNEKDTSNEQRISAIDKLGKYGLSGSVSADDVRERLKATLTRDTQCVARRSGADAG
jgi:hypothetical protein